LVKEKLLGTMADATTETKNTAEAGRAQEHEIAPDEDRDTFLPRPSDDPNDPLNWPMYLKVNKILLFSSNTNHTRAPS
jgi:hypothetical protein